MNFAPQMDTLMKPFLGAFGQCERPAPLTKADQKIYQSILISLYKDIYAANATIFKDGCFQSQLITEKSQFKQPEGRESRYFPAHIQKRIEYGIRMRETKKRDGKKEGMNMKESP